MRIIKVTSLIGRSFGEDFLLSVVFKKRSEIWLVLWDSWRSVNSLRR